MSTVFWILAFGLFLAALGSMVYDFVRQDSE